MKTISALTTLIMITLALNTSADDKTKNVEGNRNRSVSVAPFVWGEAQAAVPAELRYVKAKYALVPVAPLVFGNPEDELSLEDKIKLSIPVAPFIWGDPGDVPTELGLLKAANAGVPVAPFVWGRPDDSIPEIIEVL